MRGGTSAAHVPAVRRRSRTPSPYTESGPDRCRQSGQTQTARTGSVRRGQRAGSRGHRAGRACGVAIYITNCKVVMMLACKVGRECQHPARANLKQQY